MKTIAIVDANLQLTPIGTASHLADNLAGIPILRRTIERLCKCTRLSEIVVITPPEQAPTTQELLAGLSVTMEERRCNAPPYRALVRTARKWSSEAWRGGLGGCCAFDEYADVALYAEVLERHQAEAIAAVYPGAAFIDPAITDAMIEYADDLAEDTFLVFAQAPPGTCPTLMRKSLCCNLASKQRPAGWALNYQPDDPRPDLAFRPCCFPMPQTVRHAAGRVAGDTARCVRTMSAILGDNADSTIESVCQWLTSNEGRRVDTLPQEVEIELTTDSPLPNSVLLPRGKIAQRRGPMPLETIENLASELGKEDDSLVVLRGHGDPLLHPDFAKSLRILREGGVWGLSVYTTCQSLSDEAIAALLATQVDAVVVPLDAWQGETYKLLTGGACLDEAKKGLQRICDARQASGQPYPIIVPLFTKCTKNVQEMDDFFDGWLREQGCATIQGYSHYSRRLEDLCVIDMTTPTRIPCRRLWNRCAVLADGTVVACDQDFAGELPLGHLGETTLKDIWQGPRAAWIRGCHTQQAFDTCAVCDRCDEWHRP